MSAKDAPLVEIKVLIEAMSAAWWNSRRTSRTSSPTWADFALYPSLLWKHDRDHAEEVRERARLMLENKPLPAPITHADDAMRDIAVILGVVFR